MSYTTLLLEDNDVLTLSCPLPKKSSNPKPNTRILCRYFYRWTETVFCRKGPDVSDSVSHGYRTESHWLSYKCRYTHHLPPLKDMVPPPFLHVLLYSSLCYRILNSRDRSILTSSTQTLHQSDPLTKSNWKLVLEPIINPISRVGLSLRKLLRGSDFYWRVGSCLR